MSPVSPALALALANGITSAGRTYLWLTLPAAVLHIPVVAAVVTAPANGSHAHRDAFYLQRHPFDQRLRHFAPRLDHGSLKRRTRDAHLPGGLLLVMAFQIGQAQRFQFLRR